MAPDELARASHRVARAESFEHHHRRGERPPDGEQHSRNDEQKQCERDREAGSQRELDESPETRPRAPVQIAHERNRDPSVLAVDGVH